MAFHEALIRRELIRGIKCGITALNCVICPSRRGLAFSSLSLHFSRHRDSNSTMSRSGAVAVQITVIQRYLELLKQHQLITEKKAPAFPLLSEHPSTTTAILICKLLVPVGEKKVCLDVRPGQCTTPWLHGHTRICWSMLAPSRLDTDNLRSTRVCRPRENNPRRPHSCLRRNPVTACG